MALNTLLFLCLSNKTQLSENKAKISLKPEANEILLFFDMKNENTANKIRQDWGMKLQGSKLCDGIIYYRSNPEAEPIFCLIELKGNDVEHAAEQIKETYEALKKSLEITLKPTSCRELVKSFKYKAYIAAPSPPPKSKASAEEILKSFLKKGYYTVGTGTNFASFLRGNI